MRRWAKGEIRWLIGWPFLFFVFIPELSLCLVRGEKSQERVLLRNSRELNATWSFRRRTRAKVCFRLWCMECLFSLWGIGDFRLVVARYYRDVAYFIMEWCVIIFFFYEKKFFNGKIRFEYSLDHIPIKERSLHFNWVENAIWFKLAKGQNKILHFEIGYCEKKYSISFKHQLCAYSTLQLYYPCDSTTFLVWIFYIALSIVYTIYEYKRDIIFYKIFHQYFI